MPSTSNSQQRLMGMALAYKRGQLKGAPSKIKKVAGGMNEGQLEDYARKRKSRQGLANAMTKENNY